MDKELRISAISKGTVIDHIPPELAFKIARMLELGKHTSLVTIATNLPSRMMGKKALIKIGEKFLTKEEFNKIAILAPDATVNIIKNYDVKQKTAVKLPKLITQIIRCSNPNAITNHASIKTKFSVTSEKPLKVRCHYCERCMGSREIEIK